MDHHPQLFALIGSFEIVVDESKAIFPTRTNVIERAGLTLTSDGLRILAEKHPHLIPDTPLRQIQDKSKGSSFAKTLVCFQGEYKYVPSTDSSLLKLGVELQPPR